MKSQTNKIKKKRDCADIGLEKKSKLLVKTLTRDIPVIAIEDLYNGIEIRTRDFFGFEFSKNLCLFRNGTTEIYRESESFNKELPLKLSEWARKNNNRLTETYKGLYDALNLIKILENKKFSKPEDIIKSLNKVNEAFANGFLGIITTFWFPIWQENHLKSDNIKLFEDSLIEEVKEIREKTDIFFDGSLEEIYSLLDKLAAIKEWDKELLKFITLNELNEALSMNKMIFKSELIKRKENAFAYFSGKIIFESELDEFLDKAGFTIQKETEINTNVIKGAIANKGQAKGIAKVILNREQLPKIKVGEILVAPMTTPWYLPAMQKAIAFVTDEGGVTCHAAIISREMNKPCVIGTKIATQTIKDGDLIEVDADNGLIKILKQKK